MWDPSSCEDMLEQYSTMACRALGVQAAIQLPLAIAIDQLPNLADSDWGAGSQYQAS